MIPRAQTASVIELLSKNLAGIKQLAGDNFSGIGLIVCNPEVVLPIYPLRVNDILPRDADLIQYLATISSLQNEFHDGFHVLSADWQLLKISQYFSPPILADAKVDRTKRFGGRYLAALFGSALPGVVACGVASNGFGLAIFQNGREVHYERSA
jgi:hypothetical protein